MSAPIHERRKLVKTYKNELPRKRIVVAKVYGETYSKNEKKMEQKNGHKRKKLTPQIKGERWERQREVNYLSFHIPLLCIIIIFF